MKPIEDEDDEIIRIICSNQYRQLSDAQKYEMFEKLHEAVQAKLNKENGSIGNRKEFFAKMLNMSLTQTQRLLRIKDNLNDDLKQDIIDGNLSINQAEEISKLPDDEQAEAASEIIEGKKEKPKEVSPEMYKGGIGRLEVIPDLIEDLKANISGVDSFDNDEVAIKADKLIKQIRKSIEKLNELLEDI